SGRSRETMYASIGSEVPGDGWTFEPKYDGVRVLAYATSSDVKLVTRNGKDKAKQFPEIVASLKKLASQTKRPLVLDGEIVALIDGEPARFQELQSRMHVKDSHIIERHSSTSPAALILFDILMDGDEILLREPWSERRARLVSGSGSEKRNGCGLQNRSKAMARKCSIRRGVRVGKASSANASIPGTSRAIARATG